MEAKITASGSVVVTVEREYSVEVVGETKLCVLVTDALDDEAKDDSYTDDYEELDDFADLDPDTFLD